MNIQSLPKLPLSGALLKFLFHLIIFLAVLDKTVKPSIKVLLTFVLRIKHLSS